MNFLSWTDKVDSIEQHPNDETYQVRKIQSDESVTFKLGEKVQSAIPSFAHLLEFVEIEVPLWEDIC